MKRTLKLRWLVLPVVMTLTLWGCHPQQEEKKPNSPALPKDEVVLGPNSPKREYIKESVVALSIRPLMDPVTATVGYDESRTVRVFSPISGRVIGDIAPLGVKLKAHDVLAILNSPELGQAESDLAQAQSSLELAKRNFDRQSDLYGHGVAPRKDFEQAQGELQRAQSETERARLRLANLGVDGGQMDNRFPLLAPIGGEVTERNINPGMEVRPDLPAPLFVLSDLARLWLWMDVFEKDIGLLHSGQRVVVKVPAYPLQTFAGTVDYISRVVDPLAHTVKVRCVLPNPERKLLPAMYAKAELQSGPQDLGIVIPLSALFTEGESDWVYVEVADYHYLKRPVKVGLRLKDAAVIEDGLEPGERLVVDGALLLRTEQDNELQSGEKM